MNAKALRDFHHREPKLLVDLELAALLEGRHRVVQNIEWLSNSPQSTLFPAYAHQFAIGSKVHLVSNERQWHSISKIADFYLI